MRWGLLYKEKLIETYDSPVSAADSFYNQTTSHSEWNSLEQVAKPADISDWKEIC